MIGVTAIIVMLARRRGWGIVIVMMVAVIAACETERHDAGKQQGRERTLSDGRHVGFS
jgi:hypothetical protein